MATVTPAQQKTIANLYIGLFNRAPDASGLLFWTDALANGVSLEAITSSFIRSPESQLIYTASQTAEQFVAAFYQTVFGRAPDASGLVFWTGVLSTAGGVGSDVAKAVLVLKIVELVSSPLPTKPDGITDAAYAQTVGDRDLFNKKVVASLEFALVQKSDDLALARKVIADLTAPTPPTAPDPSPAPVGASYLLTTDPDTHTADGGNDTFNAPMVGNLNTLNDGDTLDGGAGIDTLNVTLGSFAVVAPTLRNIEIVNLTGSTDGAQLRLGALTGLTQASITGGAGNVFMVGVGNAALSVSNRTTNTGFGGSTATDLSLNFDRVGTNASNLAQVDIASIARNSATTYSIVLNDAYVNIVENWPSTTVRDASIVATGINAFRLPGAVSTTVQTVTISGDGSVNFLNASLSALKTFTSTGAGDIRLVSTTPTAGVLDITTGAGADTITANGASIKTLRTGAGNDVITLDTGALQAAAVVELGAGDDTLILSVAPAAGATLNGGGGRDTLQINQVSPDYAAITSQATDFEVLALGVSGATVNVAQVNRIESFAVVNTGTTSFTNAKNTSTFSIDNSAGVVGVNIGNAVGQTVADIVLSNTGSTPAARTLGSLAVTSATAISLTSTGSSGNSNVATLLTSDNTTVTVKGALDLTLTLGLGVGGTLDATSFTGNLTVQGSGNNDIIKGGAGADKIRGGSGADTLAGGGGIDSFYLSGTAATRSGFTAADTTANNIEKITDFVADSGAGDRIYLEPGAITGVVLDAATTLRELRTMTVATADNFTQLMAAVEALSPGRASTSASVLMYSVAVTAGNLLGHYLIVNDGVAAVATTDMIVSLTGITGVLTPVDILIGAFS